MCVSSFFFQTVKCISLLYIQTHGRCFRPHNPETLRCPINAPNSNFRAGLMKKIPEEYFTYNLQESLVLSSKAYAEKHLLPDDMSMCFTHGFNVGRFHRRRGCRPVCARLTTPPLPLCCGLFLQERFFKLYSPV